MKTLVEQIVARLTPYYPPEEAQELAYWVIQETTGMIRFDVVISFDAPSRQAVFAQINEDLKKKYPQYEFTMAMDMDYGEVVHQ